MSSFIVCPDCHRKLKVPETLMGKSFRCPACKAVIPPPPSLSVQTAPSPQNALLPSRRRPSPDEDEIEDIAAEEEPIREKATRKRKPIRKKSSTGLIVGLAAGCGGLFVLALAFGGGMLWYFLHNKTIPQSEWQTFAPPDSGCTVLMPGVPVPKTMNIGELSVKHYHVLRKKENAAFEVGFFDLPAPVLPPNMLDTLAKGGRDKVLAMSKGNVSREASVSLGNLPGREYQIKLANGETYITRLYLAKVGNTHRAYQVGAGGSNIQPNMGDGARFFDSFKIDAAAEPPKLDAAAPQVEAQPPPAVKPPQANPPANAPRPNPGRQPPRGPRPRS